VKGSFSFALYFGSVVDEFAAVIAVKFQNWEGDGVFDVREGLECPCMGLVEEGIEVHPSGSNVHGGQREDVLTGSDLPAVVANWSPTVPVCQKPGVFRSSSEEKARMGIRLFSERRGLARLFPLRQSASLSFSVFPPFPR
jgi:hypothetical protein